MRHGGAAGTLVDSLRHGSGAELFVVEGESAGLAVTRVRDADTQAVLPMQGKPTSALSAPERKLVSHPFYAALAEALGAGAGAACDPQGLRFGRLLLLMDPDADGIHCGLLVLMFLHRCLRPVLDAGIVEIVRPPWGEVASGGGPPRVAFSEPEFQAFAAEARPEGGVARRYRGLAGIDHGLLLAHCIAPATRRTERVASAHVAAMIATFSGRSPGR
jgi:DNA gyrase subunit B/topoisomerase-4 subunit B